MTLQDLPALNAGLNAAAGLLSLSGFLCIKKRKVTAHKVLMLAAVVCSIAFLTSYIVYHIQNPKPTAFAGPDRLKYVYYTMLITHVILAVSLLPLVGTTVYLGLRNRLKRHVRLARWTFPIWMYVSVTGVLVYLSLYVWWPGA